jgi:hypothetical protein
MTVSPPPGRPPARGMVWIPGGTFTMGSDAHYPEEAPAHRVVVGTYQRSCPLEAQLLSSWIQPTALFGSWASWPVEMLHHSLRLLVMASAPDCG